MCTDLTWWTSQLYLTSLVKQKLLTGISEDWELNHGYRGDASPCMASARSPRLRSVRHRLRQE